MTNLKVKDISIVIADDHPMLLKGLKEELTLNHYNVIGEATNGIEALELIIKLKPSIAILDIDMPFFTGFEIVKLVKEKKIPTKFIIQTFHKDLNYISQSKLLNIQGYLLKEDSFLEIEKCIKKVVKNKVYYSPSIKKYSLKSASKEIQKLQLLSPSEITILKLIAKQISTNDIAQNLSVSPRTIEKHRSNIISKIEISNSTNTLTNWAINNQNIITSI